MVDKKYMVAVPKYLEDLIPGFIENRKEDVPRINACLESADFETIRRIAHDMKGVGSGYGFHRISELGAEIGSAARSADSGTLAKLNVAYRDYLDNLDVQYV